MKVESIWVGFYGDPLGGGDRHVDGWIGRNKWIRLRQPAGIENSHHTLAEGVYDERDHEAAGRRRKLADLLARDPGKRNNLTIQRFSDEDDIQVATDARDWNIHVRKVKA